MSADRASDETQSNARPPLTVPDITHQIESVSLWPEGYGGQADVYRGQWRHEGQGSYNAALEVVDVAIKVLRVAGKPSPNIERRLYREIGIWQQLRHRNVQSLLGIRTKHSALPAMVSPWHVNGDIIHYLRTRPDDPRLDMLKVQLLTQAVDGLSYLHNMDVVHGDIKGGNVLIAQDGSAKLADFGFSQLLTAASRSQCSTSNGTTRWMAPELLEDDQSQHTVLSDIWACGCLFIEVQCDVLPFHTIEKDQKVILALSGYEVPPRPPSIPDRLWSLVLECCRPQHTDRISVNEISRTLQVQIMILSMEFNVMDRSAMLRGADALLRSVQECYIAQACPAEIMIEALNCIVTRKYSIHVGSFDVGIVMDELLLTFLAICIQQFIENTSRMSQTTLMLTISALLAIPLPEELLVILEPRQRHTFLTRRYPPVQLCPLARALAVTDVKHASTVMRLFSSTLGPVIHSRDPSSVAWLSNGARIVSASFRDLVQLWDVATGQLVMDMPGHTATVWGIEVSPAGDRIASSSGDGTVRIWDAISGAAVGQPLYGHTGGVFSVSFSPDGIRVASGSDDKTLRIWSVETGRTLVGPMRGHTSIVRSVTFSPDGASVVSGSWDNTIRIWDAQTGICTLGPLEGHTNDVNSVAFSPDGRRIVSGSDDNTIRIWDATTGQTVVGPLTEHEDWVRAVAWSPDGTCIASASDDATICIWNAETGKLIAAPKRGHTNSVLSVAFSPDGRRVASASPDGTIRFWDATGNWMRWDI